MPRFLIIMVERLFDVFCLHFFFKVFLGSQAKGQGNRVGLRFSEGIFAQSFLAEGEAIIFVFSEELAFYSGGESPLSVFGGKSFSRIRADFWLPTARKGGYIGGMNVKMADRWGQTIFGSTVIMLAAFASGCRGLSARQPVSSSPMLLSGFGSVVIGPPGFSLVGDRCDCGRSIFRVKNGVLGLGCRSTS